jgi:hypothetical protein
MTKPRCFLGGGSSSSQGRRAAFGGIRPVQPSWAKVPFCPAVVGDMPHEGRPNRHPQRRPQRMVGGAPPVTSVRGVALALQGGGPPSPERWRAALH